jgi:hypothetical protein
MHLRGYNALGSDLPRYRKENKMAKRLRIGVVRSLTAAGALGVSLTIVLVGPSSGGAATAASPTEAPKINTLVPNEGFFNQATLVRIKGKNLSAHGLTCDEPVIAPCQVSVSFGANPARVIHASPKEDIVVSPTVATPQTVNVTVTVSGVASNSLPFTYHA